MDENRLRYRRQFLLSRVAVPELAYWRCMPLKNGHYLYIHPDLEITYKEQKDRAMVLLGYIFNPAQYAQNNDEILGDICERTETFGSLINAIKKYVGQFVIIYLDNLGCRLVHDPLALREVYYCTAFNRIICGSQPSLIKHFSDPPLEIAEDQSLHNFYKKDMRSVRSGRLWIGDGTYFDGIKHLLPNHYLDISELKAIRYWPSQPLQTLRLNDGIVRACDFLIGALKAALNRYDLMMAITAGTDSRTLLAASKGIKENIYFFINKNSNMDENHPDIKIPSSICKRFNIPFHVHSLQGEINADFRDIFLNNTFLSTDLVLPAIYNVYYLNHSKRLNILGVGEIGRSFFGKPPRNLDGYYLARSLKFKNSLYATDQCQKWLDGTYSIAQKCNVNVMTLLLWEQLLGNWGAVGNSESDIAIEEFDPFNSHYLYELLLSLDMNKSNRGGRLLFRKMIQHMWPELLDFPINPPQTMADFARTMLNKMGMMAFIKTVIYKVDQIRFKLINH